MKLHFVVLVFASLVAVSIGQLQPVGNAIGHGFAELVSNVAKVSTLIPQGLPVLGQQPMVVPTVLGLKALGLLKTKMLLGKLPFLAPYGLGLGLLKAKVAVGKAAMSVAQKTTSATLDVPFKLSAMGVGAVAGAKAGFHAGLGATKNLPKTHLIHPHVIPASSFLKEYGTPTYAPSPKPSYRRRREAVDTMERDNAQQ